jgi:integrase
MFKRLIGRAAVRLIRLHDLRHMCATLLVLGGVLGHSQVAVAMNGYGHVLPAMQREAAGQMDQALGDPAAVKDPDAGM